MGVVARVTVTPLLKKGFKVVCKPAIVGFFVYEAIYIGPAKAAENAVNDGLWPISEIWSE
jgi:hypothetical protein